MRLPPAIRRLYLITAASYGVPSPNFLNDDELLRAIQQYDPTTTASHIRMAPAQPFRYGVGPAYTFEPEQLRLFDPNTLRTPTRNRRILDAMAQDARERTLASQGQLPGIQDAIRFGVREFPDFTGVRSGRQEVLDRTLNEFVASRVGGDDFFQRMGLVRPHAPIRTGSTDRMVERIRQYQSFLGRTATPLDTLNTMSPAEVRAMFDKLTVERRYRTIYDWFAAQGPEFKEEVGGYATPGIGGKVPSEYRGVFERAIIRREEETAAQFIKVANQIQGYQTTIDLLGKITGDTPDYDRARIQRLWDRRNALDVNAKSASQAYFQALSQRAQLNADRELAHDLAFGNDISRARALHTIFQRNIPLSIQDQREIERLRRSDGDIEAYLSSRQEQLGTRLSSAEMAARVAQIKAGTYRPPIESFDAITDALNRIQSFQGIMAKRQAQVRADVLRINRNLFDLHALGAMPTPEGGIGNAVRLPATQYPGHRVVFTGMVNTGAVLTPDGWQLPSGSLFNPGIGLTYRPETIKSVSKIQYSVVEQNVPTAPILKAFEIAGIPPELVKEARADRKKFYGSADEVMTNQRDRADETLQEAITRVDQRYSDYISAKIVGATERFEESQRSKFFAIYKTASGEMPGELSEEEQALLSLGGAEGGIDPGVIGEANREAFSAVLDPINARKLRAARSATKRIEDDRNIIGKEERLAAARAVEADILKQLGRGETMTPARVAQEIIAGTLHGQMGHTGIYSNAYTSLWRNKEDDFSKSVKTILGELIPEVKTIRQPRIGMTKDFKRRLQIAAPTLGIDPTGTARFAAIRREMRYIRQESMTGRDRLRFVGSAEDIQGAVEAFGKSRRKPGVMGTRNVAEPLGGTDISLPNEVIDRLSQLRLVEDQRVRETVEQHADLELAREVAYERYNRARNAHVNVNIVAELREAYRQANQTYVDTRRALQVSNPRRFAKVEELLNSARATLVTARRTLAIQVESAGPVRGMNNALEIYRQISSGVPPNINLSAEELAARQALARRQGGFLEYLQRVSAGGVPNVSLRNITQRHLEQLQRDMELQARREAEEELTRPLTPAREARLRREADELRARHRPPPSTDWEELYEQMSPEAWDTLHNNFQRLHGWDDYTKGIFDDVLYGVNVNPFFGPDPGSIFENLTTLQREGTEISGVIPGFRENLRSLNIVRPDEEVRLRIAHVQQLPEVPGGELSPYHMATTFHVLGQTRDNDIVPVIAALHYDEYVAALKANPATKGWSPTSQRGRRAILQMAAEDIKAGKVSPQITVQMKHETFTGKRNPITSADSHKIIDRVNNLAVKNTGSPIYTAEQIASFADLSDEELRDVARNAIASYNSRSHGTRLAEFEQVTRDPEMAGILSDLAETLDTGEFGGFYGTPTTSVMERMQNALYLQMDTDSLVRAGANTVTSDRMAVNTAIARRSVLWRKPRGIIPRLSDAAARSKLITDERYLPVHPVTGERLMNWWEPIVGDIDEALQSHGLNWEIANSVSQGFEGIQGGATKAINLGGIGSRLTEEVRARARKEMNMMERGVEGAPFTENYLYAPLATGKPIRTGEGETSQRMFDLLAEQHMYTTLPEPELHQLAGTILHNAPLASMSRDEIFEAMANAGFDYRPKMFAERVGNTIAEQIHGMLEPTMYSEVLGRPEYSSVRRALDKHFSYNVQMPEDFFTAAELGTKANRLKEEAIKSQFYKKVNAETISKAWENPLFRAGTYAVGALGLVGIIGGRRKKDHTQQDANGPDYLPGGSAYEQPISSSNGFTNIDSNYQVPSYQPGVIYQVRATGDYDPDKFQNQVQGITGGSVSGTVYNARRKRNNSMNRIQDFYG